MPAERSSRRNHGRWPKPNPPFVPGGGQRPHGGSRQKGGCGDGSAAVRCCDTQCSDVVGVPQRALLTDVADAIALWALQQPVPQGGEGLNVGAIPPAVAMVCKERCQHGAGSWAAGVFGAAGAGAWIAGAGARVASGLSGTFASTGAGGGFAFAIGAAGGICPTAGVSGAHGS